MKLLIIGNRGGTNVGGCFERAARRMGNEVNLLESKGAMRSPRWLRYFNWHWRGHRPTRLNDFGELVIQTCDDRPTNLVIATGVAPLTARVLVRLRERGIRIANYLTDDPWNPAHYAPWFLEALPHYTAVFSPRSSNLGDLTSIGCTITRFLPFAYDPELHFVEQGLGPGPDVVFIGGGDPDRVPFLAAVPRAGLRLVIYGDYWQRYADLASHWAGYADLGTARRVSSSASVCLCLVRRANRDGHTMRSFEAAAMGGCLLVEASPEHRAIFGQEGEAVAYFASIQEMIQKAKRLVAQPEERRRLAAASLARITHLPNTYQDRLETIQNGMLPRSSAPLPCL